MARPTWAPTPDSIENANITGFMRAEGIASLDALWEYARSDIGAFYDKLVRRIGLSWMEPYRSIVDLSKGAPFAKWFAGGTYNASENCLDKHIRAGRGADEALVWEGEDGSVRTFTF